MANTDPSFTVTARMTLVIDDDLRRDNPGLTDEQIAQKIVNVVLTWGKHSYSGNLIMPAVLSVDQHFPKK